MKQFFNNFQTNVLKELGLKDSNQWILYEEKPKKFFEHITDNLDDDNVLTDKELKFYEVSMLSLCLSLPVSYFHSLQDLVAAKQFLEGDSLSDQLKSLEFRYSGINTLTDNEVDELELDLRILEADTKDREERILRMKETHRHQLNDIVEVEKRKFERDYQETQITESCILMAQDLSKIQESNKQKTMQLNEIYTQPVSTVSCINFSNDQISVAQPSRIHVPNASGATLPQMRANAPAVR